MHVIYSTKLSIDFVIADICPSENNFQLTLIKNIKLNYSALQLFKQ